MSVIAALRARRAVRGGPPSRPAQSDVQRILSLPQREPITDPVAIKALCASLTARLRKPGGTMTLLPVQALALHEAETYGKVFGAIAPGLGKALLSLLLPVVLKSQKCVLLVPAALREQTMQRVVPQMSQHWRIPTVGLLGTDADIVVVTHNEASAQKTANFLFSVKPDLVVIDEAHAFARDSSRGSRLFYFAGANPETRVVPLSGSLIDPELEGASRLGSISLREGSPYPRTQDAVRLAVALDTGITSESRDFATLIEPGKTLRESLRSRVYQTPGVVVAPRSDFITVPLVVKARYPAISAPLKAALKKLRDEWTTPAGIEFSEAVEFHRHAMELSQGFCYRWDWPNGPDEEWLAARRDWFRAVRRRLQRPMPGMDSEGLLRKAAAAGIWKTPAYAPWAAVMNRTPPPTVADWVSTCVVEDAVKWGSEKPGVIWYKETAFGEAVSKAGGFPLYDGGPANGQALLKEDGSRTLVMSRSVYAEGTELQQYSRCYVSQPSSRARATEQLFSRHHRIGQKADAVEVHVCLHTPELVANFANAREEAQKMAESAPGAERQKILFADVAV